MFGHLVTDVNRIQVLQQILNRDGDVSATVVIGEGYGVFRTKTLEEVMAYTSSTFDSVGTLLFYTANEPQSIVVGNNTIVTHTEPRVGDTCTWRGMSYTLTGIEPRIDINGDLVGYTVRCSNG